MREPVYKFYSWLFGCEISEALEQDLKTYPNLGAFFYRALKPGARPIDDKAALVSPADGRVLHFGLITESGIEQVKGVTYSLDALLGKSGDRKHPLVIDPSSPTFSAAMSQLEDTVRRTHSELVASEQNFAEINAVDYTLDKILGDKPSDQPQTAAGDSGKGVKNGAGMVKEPGSFLEYHHSHGGHAIKPGNALFFCVIYLAPGDYHRFHSPAEWVVEKRRHFAGELFSVSPWMVKVLQNLFVLNERVVLLGEWAHGFFSMIPVGATNVGSIKINFDPTLQTNLADRQSPTLPGTYTELAYDHQRPHVSRTDSGIGSEVLAPSSPSTPPSSTPNLIRKRGGLPMGKGDEMGGFQLGSTVLLVFEAPKDQFEFRLEQGQRVRVGQAIGVVKDDFANPNTYKVAAHLYNLRKNSKDEGGISFDVLKWYIHPNYTRLGGAPINDIALWVVKEKDNFSLQPPVVANVASDATVPANATSVFVAG
ncbi:phosphatidylserine decarboxylase 1 [Quaeritorhiza haematococci]|nr:phosphatidylserine decarboxylase 1 [Quaeritorhiza haematococci]